MDSMDSIFEISAPYHDKVIKVMVQRLTEKSPHIYAIWPQDNFLKYKFDGGPVFFTQFVQSVFIGNDDINHKVAYPKNTLESDEEFEVKVWKQIVLHETLLETPIKL